MAPSDGAMSIVTGDLRRRVLSAYKTALRLAQNWTASDATQTKEESLYIKTETRTKFRQNADVSDPEEIRLLVRECEARVAMADHYKNPYPRAINLPPMGLPTTLGNNRSFKVQRKKREMAKPIYVRSSKELD